MEGNQVCNIFDESDQLVNLRQVYTVQKNKASREDWPLIPIFANFIFKLIINPNHDHWCSKRNKK